VKRSIGFSTLEFVAVLALLGVMVSLGFANLKGFGNPSQNGSLQFVRFMNQVKAKAISSGSSYRIYPISKKKVVVRKGRHCASQQTQIVTKFSLQMPVNAEFTDIDWSVCLSAKGLPTDNTEVYVVDTTNPSQVTEIEIHPGEMVRVRYMDSHDAAIRNRSWGNQD
jgi:Tfp pilus assembly protein FimT